VTSPALVPARAARSRARLEPAQTPPPAATPRDTTTCPAAATGVCGNTGKCDGGGACELRTSCSPNTTTCPADPHFQYAAIGSCGAGGICATSTRAAARDICARAEPAPRLARPLTPRPIVIQPPDIVVSTTRARRSPMARLARTATSARTVTVWTAIVAMPCVMRFATRATSAQTRVLAWRCPTMEPTQAVHTGLAWRPVRVQTQVSGLCDGAALAKG